ncbi:phospholipase A [Halomonas rhizosphaerae]|uniref:Phospholipase A1 n=1 Tax=Halomonas rhizosphaerae TaxID=3043296 RepID=A0ABT6V4P8_9GAMM|nr:phospholipase A [Halomonas rhizosphaerae]MDI5893190.1 phospholipase A [Halomonas rhizosphaerae]
MSARFPLLAAALTLAGLNATAMAAEPLSEAEREAIEARIAALQEEMGELRRQLTAADGQGTQAAALVEEAADQELEEAVDERRQLERESAQNPFAITTHRRNYWFPLSYNASTNDEIFRNITDRSSPDRAEMKFQFSAKFNLVEDLFGDYGGDLHFAYTQRSWWQAFNADASSPFRETNYEPEVFIDFENRWSLLGWTNINNRLAFNHQSNGRSDPLSRSWNRLILESTIVNDDWALTLAPHWRIPESEEEDDNPDIHKYLGYGDITLAHRLNGDNELSLMLRGNPSDSRMGTQVDYSWPLFGSIRGHVQYYYGYGESLIDYDRRNHRLSLGFSLNPLFSAGSLEPQR